MPTTHRLRVFPHSRGPPPVVLLPPKAAVPPSAGYGFEPTMASRNIGTYEKEQMYSTMPSDTVIVKPLLPGTLNEPPAVYATLFDSPSSTTVH